MQIIELTGGNNVTVLPQIITDNTIYILNSGTYTTINKLILSWSCIALVWKDNPILGISIDTEKADYIIIDGISHHNKTTILPKSTITTWINISIENNSESTFFTMTGDIEQELSGTINKNERINYWINLIKWNNENNIDIVYFTGNIVNHKREMILHDNIIPSITWISLKNEVIVNNWLFNTWIYIEIYDKNLSGVFNNAIFLSGWTNSWNWIQYKNTFTTEWIYNIIAIDKIWNQSNIWFEIDTTEPIISDIIPYSWQYISSTTLSLNRFVQENNSRIKSQKYFIYSWTNLITSWTVLPGGTWVILPNIQSWTYNRKIEIEDKAGNIWLKQIPIFRFNKQPIVFISTENNQLNNIWYTNTNPVLQLSWNKNFEYKITRSGNTYTWSTSGNYTNTLKNEIIPRIWSNTWNLRTVISYKTQDNEIWTGIMNFYIDKTNPNLSLYPLGWRFSWTNDIYYTRSPTNKSDFMIMYYNFSINNTVVYSGKNNSYIKTGVQENQEYKAQICAYDIAKNYGCSPIQNRIIDKTPPQIYNVTSGWFYKTIPNPIPIIIDENNEKIYVTIKKDNITIYSWEENSPYGIPLQWWEFMYEIITNDIPAMNTTGIKFTIDTTLPFIQPIYPLSGTTITGNNNILFSRSWYDKYFSWFEFILSGYSYWTYYTWIYTTWNQIEIKNLNNSDLYQRRVFATDKAGNKTKSPVQNIKIQVPLTWEISLGWISTIWYINYTNKNYINIITNINKPSIATITWDILSQYSYQFINKEIAAWLQTTQVQLTTGEWQKNIYIKIQDYTNSITTTKNITVDTTVPNKPILTNINNNIFTWDVTLHRTPSIDWGLYPSWIKEYNYIIQEGNTVKKIGTWSNPSVIIENMELGKEWTFSIKVQSADYAWNQSERSDYAIFKYTWIPDISPNTFSFSGQTNVQRNTIYRSNSITISWLSLHTSVLAIVDEWRLFINWTDVNKEALIKNGDVLYIELKSSNNYNTINTSTLTINDKVGVFSIITHREWRSTWDNTGSEYIFTTEELLELNTIYLTIKELDINLKKTLKGMLEDTIDKMEQNWESKKEIGKLNYIYNLLKEELEKTQESLYTAPNWKQYTIVYQQGLWYTSTNFKVTNQTRYFSTLEEIKNFINKNNPSNGLNYTIDYWWSSAPYKAPNNKTYNLFKTTTWKYWSYNMIMPKLFNSLKDLQEHINKNNPKK